MTHASGELRAIAAEWRRARRIYPIYTGIAARFQLDLPPCKELDSPIDSADPETLAGLRRWFQHADESIRPHQLRFFLQTSSLSTELSLRALAKHLLQKKESGTAADRDKLDFLLVQYFAQCAPLAVLEGEPTAEDVVRVLEPLLGKVTVEVPGWRQALEELRLSLDRCTNMRELLQNGILAQIRKVKTSADDNYFDPSVLAALVRVNYLIRQTFFRIMRADVEAIRDAVSKLRRQGIKTVDATRAQLSRTEPLESVLQLSRGWKKPFQAAYSAGTPFAQLAELRVALDEALARHGIEVERRAPVRPPKPSGTASRAASAARDMKETAKPVSRRDTHESLKPALEDDGISIPARSFANVCSRSQPSVDRGARLFEHDRTKSSPRTETAQPASRPPVAASPTRASHHGLDEASLAEEMQAVVSELATRLQAKPNDGETAGTTVTIANLPITVSSWEATAFVDGIGGFSEVIQEGVAARVLLLQAVQEAKRGASRPRLSKIIALAERELTRLNDALAESRDARDIEATVTLSATSHRLAEGLEEARKLGSGQG